MVAVPNPTGLRKFIVVIIVVGAATWLKFTNHLVSDDSYTSLMIWVTGLFMGGNVGAKLAEKISIKLGEK